MKLSTKKLIIIFVIMVVLGGGLIYYLQKGKTTTESNKDKSSPKEKDSPNKGSSKSSSEAPAPKAQADTPIVDNGIPIRKADRETIKLVQTDLNRIAMYSLQKPIKVDGVWGKQTQQFAINVIGRDIANMTYAQFANRNANATNTVAGSATTAAIITDEAKDFADKLHKDFNNTFSDYKLYEKLDSVSDQTLRGIVAHWERFKIFHKDKSLYELLDPKNYNAFGAAPLVTKIRTRLSYLGLKR